MQRGAHQQRRSLDNVPYPSASESRIKQLRGQPNSLRRPVLLTQKTGTEQSLTHRKGWQPIRRIESAGVLGFEARSMRLSPSRTHSHRHVTPTVGVSMGG